MSLASVLSIARSGLNYQQTIIQTAGHNIANAETEGFSRQRVEGMPGIPQRFTYGSVGTGVEVQNITRARDQLLDVAYRSESSGFGAATLRQELLSGVEGVFGEPADDGLAAAMDAFWSSWSDLASNPTGTAARSVVQQRGRAVAELLNGYDARLSAMREHTELRLSNSLTELNALTDEIAQLNGRIVESEIGGNQAPDLRDQRDLAIDRLSRLGDVRVLPQTTGAVTVVLGNTTVVDGIHSKPLVIARRPGSPTLALATARQPNEPILPVGGTTQTMLHFLNVELSDSQERLDALANTLARTVNQLHALGNDGTGGQFFVDKTDDFADPSADIFTRPLPDGAVTARTIALASAIEGDASRIATTSSRTARPADNDIALAMAGLRTASTVKLGTTTLGPVDFRLPDRSTLDPADRLTMGPTTLADFYRAATSSLATQVKDAESTATVRRTLVEQAETRRQSVSGVNVDEELTTLMRAQQAYAAAAKVISIADEMMDAVINMI